MLVYIASPFRGDIETNIKIARKYSRYAMEEGSVPLAPHLLFPQFMDEESERDLALALNIEVLKACKEIWVCGAFTTEGMAFEIKKAKELGIPIREVML
ncbi:DUF4406 domain-containing protein [Allofustis seminis]|uniref:DUF7768 domain-containing protein n=1 Tax=Allofustis seminis TaxID=166939 RepID=UPI00037762D8|nr:DUF4406 domain-containing protein [Allofustis seminis]